MGRITTLFVIVMLLLAYNAQAAEKINANDQMLWYDKPATHWLEALPLGNSKMGAMVFGGTDIEEIQLNEETFWSGGPHDNNSKTSIYYLNEVRQLVLDGREKEAEEIINREFIKGPHGMKYLTLGSLMMALGHKDVSNYKRELDLRNAVSTTRYTCNGVTYTRTAFASLADGVVVVNIKANRSKAITFTLSHNSTLKNSVSATVSQGRQAKTTAILEATIEGMDHEGVASALTAKCRTEVVSDGLLTASDGKVTVTGATEATLYISAATNYVNYHDVSGDASAKVKAAIESVAGMKLAQLKQRHVVRYKEQYDRVSLSLTDGKNVSLPTDRRLDGFYGSDDCGMIALLFNYGRYLLISSSQKGGQPANLQGVWNSSLKAPWDSKYTININTQMNYWPAEVCNLSENAEPLFDMIRELSETGSKTAREMYGCRGWMAHHNTDLWRIAGPVDGAKWGMFPNGGAWLTTHIWQHYLYTLDKDFLLRYYDVIKGAAEFYLDFLVERDGQLLLVPSVSPEHGGKGRKSTVTASCTMDNQIVHDALSQALLAAKVLGMDEPLQHRLAKAIAMLPPMKVGQYGQLQEWREDMDDPKDQHRHISHLYGLYPSNQITPLKTPELWKAAGVTLSQRGDQATGWSLGWKTNFWARMLDGDHAYRILSNMLRLLPDDGKVNDYPDGRTYPNLFDAHPPFQIDGNFGATAGIAEMLMQSDLVIDSDGSEGNTNKMNYRTTIMLLPALPTAWKTGEISGLKARGGYEVSVKWAEGRMLSATITPAKGIAGERSVTLITKTPLRQGKLIGHHAELGMYEYELQITEGKSVTVTSLNN